MNEMIDIHNEAVIDGMEREYFTLVFRGDLRKFKGNPLKTETPFGVPIAASLGDALVELNKLTEY